MKLKKLVLAAFIIMAVSLVMTGCPMTAKDYKKAQHEINATESQLSYEQDLLNSIEIKIRSIVDTLKPYSGAGSDVSKKDIDKKVKEFNEKKAKEELDIREKHYGVQKKKVVYNGGDLKAENYKDKDRDDITKEIMKFFSIQ